MTTYLVTGGTGFIGRHLVDLLAARDGARVLVLVRPQSAGKLDAFGSNVEPLIGDLTAPLLGVSDADR
ncbi:MAG: SDR family oxidoreductase, partial [Frankiaceae bacterium]|nr:SDR family oxidoreductase [Frankiaceae bacterium]